VKVAWSETAARRLEEIRRFVALDSPRAAEALALRLVDRGASLSRLPERGRAVPELPEAGLRELIEGNYRIVYRVRAGAVEIVTVFEAHRLLPEEDLT
jgi:plasmid stabilization system protein ParE